MARCSWRYPTRCRSHNSTISCQMGICFLPSTILHYWCLLRRYNLARDWLVGNATNQTTLVPTLSLTNATTLSGSTSYGGYTYLTSVTYVSGLLQNTSVGLNHNLTVPVPGDNAADGLVAVLGVTITQKPTKSSGCVIFPLSVGDFDIHNVFHLQCFMDSNTFNTQSRIIITRSTPGLPILIALNILKTITCTSVLTLMFVHCRQFATDTAINPLITHHIICTYGSIASRL